MWLAAGEMFASRRGTVGNLHAPKVIGTDCEDGADEQISKMGEVEVLKNTGGMTARWFGRGRGATRTCSAD